MEVILGWVFVFFAFIHFNFLLQQNIEQKDAHLMRAQLMKFPQSEHIM